jgi:flagellar assembly protein FliH
MSRKIIKSGQSPQTNAFQFQAAYPGDDGGPRAYTELEAEAELAAFEDTMGQQAPPLSEFPPHTFNQQGGPMNQGNPQPQHHQRGDMDEILMRAQADADNIVRQAQDRASQVEREAYEKGLEEGRKTGEIMAEQQLQAVLNQYHASFQALDQMRQNLVDQAQLDILDLVIHTAEKVVRSHIVLHSQSILHMIKEALNSLKSRKNVTVYLNTEDHHYLSSVNEAEQTKWLGTQVELQADPELTRGSIRLETPSGELDASIETQIEQIRERLAQGWEGP